MRVAGRGALLRYEDHRDLIDRVTTANNVEPDLVMELLALEAKHSNLHGWGARPALRRDLSTIMDAHLAAIAGAAKP